MQRLFITALACLMSVCLSAQEQVITYPYNPDADTDSLIAVPDMLDLLVLFGNEFFPEPIMVDGVVIQEWLEQNTINEQCCDSLSQIVNTTNNSNNYSTTIEYIGDMDYWDCVMNCKNLNTSSSVLDYMNIGEHKSELFEILEMDLTDYVPSGNNIFINHERGPGGWQSNTTPTLFSSDNGLAVDQKQTYYHARCICQTPNE